ncbi:ABC transporter ATP-binding protein [Curtobacterium pusillum]|uniref:ABC transporter ATP-binding protein n=1 Tax=Curtobacterium pusillum TaxID=69373 RepID=UPI002FDD3E51
MAAAAGDDDDVYTTSDAAWLTEEAAADAADAAGTEDAEDEADTEDDDAIVAGDAADDDMGDGDAHDASAEDAMTDDTTVTETTETEPDVSAAPAAAPTTTARRPGKARGGKGRATRPTQTAASTGTVPPGPNTPDESDATNATGTTAADALGTTATAPDATDTAPTKPSKKRPAAAKRPATAQKQPQQPVVLRADGLVKRYGQTLAADEVDLEIRRGSIFGVVGPNGAGKTTTLSMVTGLLRPDAGSVTVLDHDVWADPTAAKRDLGVLPDRLRLFDRLTGAQLLYYSATLRGLDGATARQRSADLAEAFGLGEALGRQVADYSVGMAKKIALAATLIHSPRVLVLDEPFESVDPVSAATITEILRRYTRGGGTVVLSSHSMELVQRTCDSVAIIVGGKVLASGTMAQVRGRKSLEDKFVELAGGRVVAESMEWLHSFSG